MNYNSREIIITCGNLIITRGNDILLTGEKYWQYMAPEGFRNNLNQCRQKAHCGWRGQFSSKTLMKFTAVENDRKWHSYHCIRQSLYIYIYIYYTVQYCTILHTARQNYRNRSLEDVWIKKSVRFITLTGQQRGVCWWNDENFFDQEFYVSTDWPDWNSNDLADGIFKCVVLKWNVITLMS